MRLFDRDVEGKKMDEQDKDVSVQQQGISEPDAIKVREVVVDLVLVNEKLNYIIGLLQDQKKN